MLSPLVFIKLVLPYIRKVIQKKNKLLFKRFIEVKLFFSFGFILPPLLIYIVLSNLAISEKELLYKELIYIRKAAGFLIIVFTPILFNKIISAINLTYKKKEFFVKYPVNSYLQLLKLLIFIISIILAICYLLNLSPWGILSGIGALGAILLLVFKDTILGLIASIQVYGGKLLQEGDWIELNDLNIDGEVMEVGLHRVKVKAWDNTITTFPTAKFLELTFKNWRGMQDSGGRRIKRKIIIALPTVQFVNDTLLKKLSNLELLEDYLNKKKLELKQANISKKEGDINRRTLTNIGCFRMYIRRYLEKHPHLRNDMTMLVRQLPINQYGLPIEIYAFTNTTKWSEYEDIQSDIFDHILASIHYFQLEAYQEPSSNDLKAITSNSI